MATRSELFYTHTANILTCSKGIIDFAREEGGAHYAELEGMDGEMVGVAVVEHRGMRFTVLDRTSNLALIGNVETPVVVSRTIDMLPRVPSFDQAGQRGYFPQLSADFAEIDGNTFYCAVNSGAVYTEPRPPHDLRTHDHRFESINFDTNREQIQPIESVQRSLMRSPLMTDHLGQMLGDFSEETIEADILERFFTGCTEGTLEELTLQDLPLGWRHRLGLRISPFHRKVGSTE